jgi:recombinase
MKKIRYLPFGYTIRNGQTVIDQQEAETVRGIFTAYIHGASLKEIAEDLTAKNIPYTERSCVWDKARISRILENAKYTGDAEFDAIIEDAVYEEAVAAKSARRWNRAVTECEGIRQLRDHIRCGQCGAPMLRHINSKRAIRESWTCSNADCGIRVRVSDGELLRKITLLMNRVIANADLMLPHPKIKHRDSAVVLNLQQQISDEMEQERPSEERIATLLCEIAGQLYKETNAKAQIAAQIARKRVSLMKPQDAFNAAYFSELIDAVSLHVGGGVVLHTKTETDICESEDKPNGSTENPKADSHPD